MKSVDHLLSKDYDPSAYHCVHFVVEAARVLLERDYSESFIGLTGHVMSAHGHSHSMTIKNRRLHVPTEGCIVLMRSLCGRAHVGLFYGGKVLHLTERGAFYQDLRALNRHYFEFKYYAA